MTHPATNKKNRSRAATLIAAFALALTFPAAGFASVTISYGGQFLRDSSNNGLSDGALVMLVSAGIDNSFEFPSGLDFAPGDDIVVDTTPVDGSFGGPGSFLDAFSLRYEDVPGLEAGQLLILRWFPTLTLADTAPGFSTEYGEFRYTGTDPLNPNPFETPADASAVDFLFLSDSGPRYDLTAGSVTAPEPGSALLLTLAGMVTLTRRRR